MIEVGGLAGAGDQCCALWQIPHSTCEVSSVSSRAKPQPQVVGANESPQGGQSRASIFPLSFARGWTSGGRTSVLFPLGFLAQSLDGHSLLLEVSQD